MSEDEKGQIPSWVSRETCLKEFDKHRSFSRRWMERAIQDNDELFLEMAIEHEKNAEIFLQASIGR